MDPFSRALRNYPVEFGSRTDEIRRERNLVAKIRHLVDICACLTREGIAMDHCVAQTPAPTFGVCPFAVLSVLNAIVL